MTARFDLGRTVAFTWVVASLGITLVLGPEVGYRGWMWLAVNDLLCIFGATHEIIVKERRK